MAIPEPLCTDESPREILANDFQSLNGGIPISGGWGYTIDDACVIERHDPLNDANTPFDGVGIEHIFVEKRIYEEMIIFQPEGQKFSGIGWKLVKQSLHSEHGRHFDKLIFDVTAFSDRDWEELKQEFEGPNGVRSAEFDEDEHERKRQEKIVHFTREFWFDITSFFGK